MIEKHLIGKKVKIRWRRAFPEQRIRHLIGVVVDASENWIVAKGRYYFLAKGEAMPRVEGSDRLVAIPREAITTVRILPDNLDLNNLEFEVAGDRINIKIPGEPDASITM